MARIDFLYFATLTESAGGDPGTDSTVNLIINDGTERLNHRFGDTVQADQERGQANLYRIDVRSRGIDSTRLVDGSIRVGVVGDDEWRPNVLFLWGFTPAPVQVRPPAVVPLAIETGVTTPLSTDDAGAASSMPLRIVRSGNRTTLINELLLLTNTAYDPAASWGGARIGDPGPSGKGTDDRIELQIIAGGGLVVQHVVPDTPQDDLESGQVNFYRVPVAVPFTRGSMATDAVRLGIGGADLWLPAALYLFGVDSRRGRPASIIPLVHIDRWGPFVNQGGLGALSTDSSEGRPQVVLPLLSLTTAPTNDRVDS